MRTIIILFILLNSVYAQITISGKVIDKQNNEPIPFASVGILGKSVGTVSDEEGNFTLRIKEYAETDVLKISAIGYQAQTFPINTAKDFAGKKILLTPASIQLSEVTVKPTKTVTKVLGNKKYNKNIQCYFMGVDSSFLGVEAAIRAKNKVGRLVWIEDFNFFINKNLLQDSVTFRLNFYEKNKDDMPGENILREPIVFKTGVKFGVVHLDLKKYNINTSKDFFISLECLTENVNKQLSFSGSIKGPAYFKFATFANWERIPLMGLDFNVTVSYQK